VLLKSFSPHILDGRCVPNVKSVLDSLINQLAYLSKTKKYTSVHPNWLCFRILSARFSGEASIIRG
jgi:hypothetical protein